MTEGFSGLIFEVMDDNFIWKDGGTHPMTQEAPVKEDYNDNQLKLLAYERKSEVDCARSK